MKKIRLYLILLVILLVTLACSLPLINQEQESSQVSTEIVDEVPTDQPTVTPEPTSTTASNEPRIFQAGGYAILLPGTFIVSDDPAEVPMLNDMLSIMDEWTGNNFTGMVPITEETIVLMGYDSADSNTIPTSLLVLKNEEYAGAPLGLMNMFAGAILGDSVNLLQSDTLQMGNRQVIRWVTSVDIEGEESNQAIYFFNDYDMLWIIVFVTEPASMSDKLSTFDNAVNSFTFN